MKKLIILMLSLAFVLSLCGCGSSATKLKYGETASTDVVDVKLYDPTFSYYISSTDLSALPEPAGYYQATSTGNVFVCFKLEITNKDRADISPDYHINEEIIVKYKGKEYKTGPWISACITGTTKCDYFRGGILIGSGKTVTINTGGRIIGLDPDSINDDFEITITLKDSKRNEYKFTFSK